MQFIYFYFYLLSLFAAPLRSGGISRASAAVINAEPR